MWGEEELEEDGREDDDGNGSSREICNGTCRLRSRQCLMIGKWW